MSIDCIIKNEIDILSSNSILIPYTLYNSLDIAEYAFDDDNKLSLQKIINNLRKLDKDMDITVNAYPLLKKSDNWIMYADMLLLKTSLSIDAIQEQFCEYEEVEPSSIEFAGDNIVSPQVSYVYLDECGVAKITSETVIERYGNSIALYWV